jgi:hypothetical protein
MPSRLGPGEKPRPHGVYWLIERPARVMFDQSRQQPLELPALGG